MNLNFADALAALGPGVALQMANQARPAPDYLFNTFLPERGVPDYMVRSGTMTIRTTMAGMVGMDSAYPKGGQVELSTFAQQAAKFAIQAPLNEGILRQLQMLVMRDLVPGGAGQGVATERVAQTALNFLDKVIIQAHLDLFEWLRGKALTTGGLDWDQNGIHLVVDYGIPAAQKLTKRTGTAAWDSSASKFWEDIGLIYKYLGVWNPSLRIIAHPTTVEAIIGNDVNKVIVVAQDQGSVRLQKFSGSTERFMGDARNTVTITIYAKEAEVYDLANPGKTKKIPFMPSGLLLAVAPTGNLNQFVVGAGTQQPNPLAELELGYTHLAPTVEGGGAPGRWSRLYTPEGRPWELVGEGVANGLPCIQVPERIVVGSSEIAGA